jgi:hypothetical protein
MPQSVRDPLATSKSRGLKENNVEVKAGYALASSKKVVERGWWTRERAESRRRGCQACFQLPLLLLMHLHQCVVEIELGHVFVEVSLTNSN